MAFPCPKKTCALFVVLATLFSVLFVSGGKATKAQFCAGSGLGIGVLPTGVDLDVIYISRTPRYQRYSVDYTTGLPIVQTKKRWPLKGEPVTFEAFIGNKGNSQSPSFGYSWYLDGSRIETGTIAPLAPQTKTSKRITIPWPNQVQGERIAEHHEIKFSVDEQNTVIEISENNNSITNRTDSPSFKIHVENTPYRIFNTRLNKKGSYSFEDWVQDQAKEFNRWLKDGSQRVGLRDYEEIRIDEIVVENDCSLPGWGEHTPQNIDWDSRWGFSLNEGWKWDASKVDRFVQDYDYGLIHEWGHQIGLIDLYRINLGNPEEVPGGISNPVNGQFYGCCSGTDPSIMLDTNQRKFGEHDLRALYSNLGLRRGFYGEYLFDIPQQNVLEIKNKQGVPVEGASITIYQAVERAIQTTPVITNLTTNSSGKVTLPNKASQTFQTATGHILHPNPFGKIEVTGTNGVFLILAEKNGQRAYGWIDITSFNKAYTSGARELAEYLVTVDLPINAGAGDANTDGVVNNLDSLCIKNDFAKTSSLSCNKSDLNLDGKVNLIDYSLVINNFGRTY